VTAASSTPATLADYLGSKACPAGLSEVLLASANACIEISRLVRRGGLAGALGAAAGENVQGEVQKALDVLANDILLKAAKDCPRIAACASEELDHAIVMNADGDHLLLFDPLDGSSNIDVNAPIGTILSVLHRGAHETLDDEAFLQSGRLQLAAAYAVYGPQTIFVVTLGEGVAAFTLDPESGAFLMTTDSLKVPGAAQEFAINMANMRHWRLGVRTYIEECLAGATGARGKNFNMRWLAAMVGDMHRVLTRGGVFLYPWDDREPSRPGKLRLMYEANPFAMLVEAAGGRAVDEVGEILDVVPTALHQRTSVVMGAREEVERVLSLSARVSG
jgi:fructose-1,6-bisphosphatase I